MYTCAHQYMWICGERIFNLYLYVYIMYIFIHILTMQITVPYH